MVHKCFGYSSIGIGSKSDPKMESRRSTWTDLPKDANRWSNIGETLWILCESTAETMAVLREISRDPLAESANSDLASFNIISSVEVKVVSLEKFFAVVASDDQEKLEIESKCCLFKSAICV